MGSSILIGVAALLALVGYQVGMGRWKMARLYREWDAAQAALQAENLEEAEAALRRCIRFEPLLVPARTLLGDVLALRGNLAEAEEHLSLAAQLEPREVAGPLNLALFYALRCEDREADARAALQQALALDPRVREKITTQEQLRPLREHPHLADLLS